ncbi:hypothetical protein KSP40_PGU019997 [Platanthera guangdongensis]|uniref:Uncharacterized protein n=1 Tax=Platanthera guangdongensis TaxID=2320717 RepID=A0ABR2MAC5_9ASPA
MNKKGRNDYPWINHWTYCTIPIGLMAMIHSDDKGLVLPPNVADVQIIVILVPCKESNLKAILAACSSAVQTLQVAGFRVEHDFRDNYTPGWKYNN